MLSILPSHYVLSLAKHTEAGVLYFNNPGNRPAGYTSQVLDPRPVDIRRHIHIEASQGPCVSTSTGQGSRAQVRVGDPSPLASRRDVPMLDTTTYAIEFKFLTPSAYVPII